MNMRNPYEPPEENGSPGYVTSLSLDSISVQNRESARRLVFWPAVLMISEGVVIAAITIAFLALQLLFDGFPARFENDGSKTTVEEVGFLVLVLFPSLFFAPLLVFCGIQLVRLRSLRLAYIGAALAALLFLPVGWIICFWTIMLLSRPEVREVFLIDQAG